jgi:hypothetical protein
MKQFMKQTEIKCAVEAAKIEADEIIDKINEWNLEIEVKIEQGNAEINRLEQWLFEKE